MFSITSITLIFYWNQWDKMFWHGSNISDYFCQFRADYTTLRDYKWHFCMSKASYRLRRFFFPTSCPLPFITPSNYIYLYLYVLLLTTFLVIYLSFYSHLSVPLHQPSQSFTLPCLGASEWVLPGVRVIRSMPKRLAGGSPGAWGWPPRRTLSLSGLCKFPFFSLLSKFPFLSRCLSLFLSLPLFKQVHFSLFPLFQIPLPVFSHFLTSLLATVNYLLHGYLMSTSALSRYSSSSHLLHFVSAVPLWQIQSPSPSPEPWTNISYILLLFLHFYSCYNWVCQ